MYVDFDTWLNNRLNPEKYTNFIIDRPIKKFSENELDLIKLFVNVTNVHLNSPNFIN